MRDRLWVSTDAAAHDVTMSGRAFEPTLIADAARDFLPGVSALAGENLNREGFNPLVPFYVMTHC